MCRTLGGCHRTHHCTSDPAAILREVLYARRRLSTCVYRDFAGSQSVYESFDRLLKHSEVGSGVTAGVENDGQWVRRGRNADDIARHSVVLNLDVVGLEAQQWLAVLVVNAHQNESILETRGHAHGSRPRHDDPSEPTITATVLATICASCQRAIVVRILSERGDRIEFWRSSAKPPPPVQIRAAHGSVWGRS